MLIRRAPLVARAVLVTGVALAGLATGAGTAVADVSVTPARSVRGAAAEVTVRVTDERDGAYTSKVELRFPQESPIAEVYPMSVPDWAPQISNRTLDQPLGGVHHGQTTQVVSAITWVRVTPAGPADAAELPISMGPMPDTDRLLLRVVQTYSDGTVVNWDAAPAADGSRPAHAAAVLTLAAADSPPPPEAAADAPGADDGASDAAGPGLSGGVLGGIALGVVLGAGAMLLLRRRAAPADDPGEAAGDEPRPQDAGDAPHNTDAPDGSDSPGDTESRDGARADAPVAAGARAPGRRPWRLRE